MNRRGFLGRSLAALILSGSGALLLPSRSYAQLEIAAVLAIVNFVGAIAGMLGRKSDPTAKLLVLNTQMLRTLSAQVSIVQATLEQVLLQLNGISAVLNQLPEAVVVEEFKGRVSGALVRYGEALQTYSADLEANGIAFANERNRAELETIIGDIREARAALFGYDSQVSLPVLAAGMQCEIYSMIMIGERDSRIAAALEAYQRWFARWLVADGPLSLPSAITADTAEFIAADAAMRTYAASREGHGCVSKAQIRLGGCLFQNEFEVRAIRSRPEAEEMQAVYRKAVADLQAEGSPVDSRLAELVPFDLFETPEGNDMLGQQCSVSGSGGTLSIEFGAEAVRRWGDDIAECRAKRVVPEEIIAENKAQVGQVRLLRDRVLMRSSFLVAANAATEFAANLRRELSA